LPRMADNWDRVAGFDKKDPFATYDRTALFSFLKNYKASREPGDEYEYSDLGYGLLSELIAIINKKSYIQCLQETILTPLQLHHTVDTPNDQKQQAMLPGLDKQGNITPWWHWQAMLGSGGLKSNIKDLMLFAVEQFKMPENEL